MRSIRLLIIFLVIVLAGVFGAHNSEYVKLDLFPFPVVIYVKMFIVPLISCIFGLLVGGIYASARASYWKAKYKRLVKRNDSQS